MVHSVKLNQAMMRSSKTVIKVSTFLKKVFTVVLYIINFLRFKKLLFINFVSYFYSKIIKIVPLEYI